jgi:hypothetical protein
VNKPDILEQTRTERAVLDALVNQLSADQMLEHGVVEDWSVKDILAHIAFWEGRCCQIMEAARRDEQPALFDEAGSFDVDTLNAQAYRLNKDRGLDEVRSEYHASYKRFVALIESLSEEMLSDPNHYEWSKGTPLWRYIDGDGPEHYREHAEHIRAWLNRPE